jgi:hypothetical protein
MSLLQNHPIEGVVQGIYYGQNERVDQLNDRILNRIHTDGPLQPNIDVRAVPTKYARFPIIDRMAIPKVGLAIAPDYSVEKIYAPIQSRGPVQGFLSNVNVESSLRNQYFALQSAAQATYIPDSKSDLYEVKMAPSSHIEQQPYPGLFDPYQTNFHSAPRNVDPKIGSQMFLNNTRTQLRTGTLNPTI